MAVDKFSISLPAELVASVDAALAGFGRIAKEWGPDERSATDLLRELRESENASGE